MTGRRVNAQAHHTAGGRSTATHSKSTHAPRGKGKLQAKIHGDTHKDFGPMAHEKFGIHAKKSENDNVGRKQRPAAHNPRQAKVANRARATVKRLSGKMI